MKCFRKNEISNNIIALVLIQFANYISPLLLLPYLSRILGVHGFGIVAIAMSMCGVSLIITDYGFGLSAPYWLAKNRSDKPRVSEYLGSIFFIKSVLFVVCAIIMGLYFFVVQTIMPHDFIFFSAIVVSVFFQTYQPSWFFLGIEKMKNVTIFMVSAKLVYLLLVFIFVKNSTQLNLVVVCFSISNFLATSLGLLFVYKEGYSIAKPNFNGVWLVFKDGAFFFLSRLAVGVYTSASTFLVGSFGGANSAAVYNSAEKLYQAGQSATSPVSQVLFPYLTRTGRTKTLYKLVGGLFFPLTLGIGFVFYFSDYIVVLIFGDAFHNAGFLLKIFMITLLVNFISVNFGYPAFASIGRVDIANKSVLIAAALQVISVFVLFIMKAISPVNVCYSVLFVEVVVMAIRVIFFSINKNNYLK